MRNNLIPVGHSPAPWHFDGPLDNSGDNDEPTSSTWFDVISGDGYSVAHLNLDARPEGQHLNQVRNDARLIAAAPTMLAALQTCLEYFEGVAEREVSPSSEAYLAVQSAISKAKGSQ